MMKMAVEINFYLSDDDFKKLRTLKNLEGYEWETYNDFAKKLLCRTMSKMYHEYIRPATKSLNIHKRKTPRKYTVSMTIFSVHLVWTRYLSSLSTLVTVLHFVKVKYIEIFCKAIAF